MAGPEASPTARVAEASDVDRIAAVLARAFEDDPVWSWMLPDEASRPRRLAAAFTILLREVHLGHGASEHAGRFADIEAAALWDPPGSWRVPLTAQARQAIPLMRAFGTRLPAAMRALGRVEGEHPKEPHWYLAFLGTDPQAQGNGLGTVLLRSRLARCDEARMPAYLESSKESNVPYYEKFGFRVTKELQMPGKGAPPVWLMWRDPEAG
ncbi:GNAT family N-acetyltransferase [Actinomadura rupiterrae]|uniref:GNAT family N-acetyltransferase n=1 Tax=Actinomadura rupiterrae TaxID=559627 RepID=UPI0020A55F78|nr:GNAT family N-acetyltransferase [Actinomadura rupiterrae]MCP2339471.1 ribosomal protein S18 acetylase RimI-like enzyme [Actinomadura rupiterrae]